MTDEKKTDTEIAFEKALDAALTKSNGGEGWDQNALMEHHPLCTIVNEERYYDNDSSCSSGRRVYVTTHYQCDSGRVYRRKNNYCT